MRREFNLFDGRRYCAYTFWGNSKLLEEILEVFCRVKGLKRHNRD